MLTLTIPRSGSVRVTHLVPGHAQPADYKTSRANALQMLNAELERAGDPWAR